MTGPHTDTAPQPRDEAAGEAALGLGATPDGMAGGEAAAAGGIDFEAVVEQYEQPLLRYVMHLLTVSRDTAEDVVQEAFLRLHRQIERYGDASIDRVDNWLFRVTHNVALDYGRKKTRRRKGFARWLHTGPPEVADAAEGRTDDGLEDMERRESVARAMAELQTLSDEQRQLVLLKVIQGMTFRQVASVTGLSVGNAAYKLNQALATLAQRLKDAEAM